MVKTLGGNLECSWLTESAVVCTVRQGLLTKRGAAREEEVKEKVGKEEKEEEEQANKNIVKEAVSLVQHARLNPSIIYRQLFC